MAQVPSTRFTAFDVLSMSRELAKTVDQKRLVTEQGRYFYKLALSEIVTLLNSSVDPSYHVSTSLTVGSNMEMLTDSTITAVNSTAKTITRSSGVFVVGSLIHVTLITVSTGAIAYQWAARITVGGATATYAVITGTDSTYSASPQNVAVFVERSNVTNPLIADISDIVYDRITSIEDSLVGQCIEVSPEVFSSLGRSDFVHQSYSDDIVWAQFGNSIRFRNGAKVTGGTKTMWYQRQPNYPTLYDDTEYVDLADKWIPLLVKRIYTYILLQTEPDIPKNLAQEMQMDYQLISGFKQAEVENKLKEPKQVSFSPNKSN
jgi:hypothetical protein